MLKHLWSFLYSNVPKSCKNKPCYTQVIPRVCLNHNSRQGGNIHPLLLIYKCSFALVVEAYICLLDVILIYGLFIHCHPLLGVLTYIINSDYVK